MIRPIITALILMPGVSARAFNPKEDSQLWTPIFLNIPAQGRLVGLIELQPRVRGDFEKLTTAIVRPWIGWRVAPETYVHAGYGWIRSDTSRVTIEHRVWQQFQHSVNPVFGWTLTWRARLEQRQLEGITQTAWRVRALLRAERALDRGLRYAVTYNEAFSHLNSVERGPRAGFDQNRVFLGLGKNGSRAKVEGGYQHIWIRRPGSDDSHIHCIVINAFLWPFGRNG